MELYLEKMVKNQDVEWLCVEIYHIQKEITEIIELKNCWLFNWERMRLNRKIVELEKDLELHRLCLQQVIDYKNRVNNLLLTDDYNEKKD